LASALGIATDKVKKTSQGPNQSASEPTQLGLK